MRMIGVKTLLQEKSSGKAALKDLDSITYDILDIEREDLLEEDSDTLMTEIESFQCFILQKFKNIEDSTVASDLREKFGVDINKKQLKRLKSACMKIIDLTSGKIFSFEKNTASEEKENTNYIQQNEIKLNDNIYGFDISWPEFSVGVVKISKKRLRIRPKKNEDVVSSTNEFDIDEFEHILKVNLEVIMAINLSGDNSSATFTSEQEALNATLTLIKSSSSDTKLEAELLNLLGYDEIVLDLLTTILRKRKEYKVALREREGVKSRQNLNRRNIQDLENDLRSAGIASNSTLRSAEGNVFRLNTAKYEQDVDPRNYKNRYVPPQEGSKIGKRAAGMNEKQSIHRFLTGPLGDLPDEQKALGKDIARYREVFVPHRTQKRNSKLLKKDIVSVKEFNSLFRAVFNGIKTLNKMQSQVYPEAYKTDNNLLVCSPTGSGKTNVAMMTILREIENNIVNNSISKDKIKVVYIAPMKALAGEVVGKFSKRLKCLKLKVRELTGDMQMTKSEINETQVIVTTPEKWDVITRKVNLANADADLTCKTRLVIIDEIHLLGEDRGYVLECLVARLLRLSRSRQQRIRLVGLSATLPNYEQVGMLLRADPSRGVFYFGSEYRPVALDQKFIGINTNFYPCISKVPVSNPNGPVSKKKPRKVDERVLQKILYNELCWKQVVETIIQGNQAMIFVHSRKETSNTVRALLELNRIGKVASVFVDKSGLRNSMKQKVSQSPNADLKEFFTEGFGIHHAGMLRNDRNLSELLFEKGAIKVLVCTATLAWGVNLPAQTVIIKGTEVYAPSKVKNKSQSDKNTSRGMSQISMQDVLQCFGRAGRPQFDKRGLAVLITDDANMNEYLKRLTNKIPLESNLVQHLPECLNAEIVSGTVTNISEAVEWLGYTFLYVRMVSDPVRYGINLREIDKDPELSVARLKIIVNAADALTSCSMLRYSLNMMQVMNIFGMVHNMEESWKQELILGKTPFGHTDLGRVASHYYLTTESIQRFNLSLRHDMEETELLKTVLQAQEFDNLNLRENELHELSKLKKQYCLLQVMDPIDTPQGKCQILAQTYLARGRVKTFTLISDMMYISKNIGRVISACFEIALRRRWAETSKLLLIWSVAFQRRCFFYPHVHVLSQFVPEFITLNTLSKLKENVSEKLFYLDQLAAMNEKEISVELGKNSRPAEAKAIHNIVQNIPYVELKATIQTICTDVIKVEVRILPKFKWRNNLHGNSQPFYIYIEDETKESIYAHERVTISPKHLRCNGYKGQPNQAKISSDTFGLNRDNPDISKVKKVLISIPQPWATLISKQYLQFSFRYSEVEATKEVFIRSTMVPPEKQLLETLNEFLGTNFNSADFPLGSIVGQAHVLGSISSDILHQKLSTVSRIEEDLDRKSWLDSLCDEIELNLEIVTGPSSVVLFDNSREMKLPLEYEPKMRVSGSSFLWEIDEGTSSIVHHMLDTCKKVFSLDSLQLITPITESIDKSLVKDEREIKREFFIPLKNPVQKEINIYAINQYFLGTDSNFCCKVDNMVVVPSRSIVYSDILNLPPLRVDKLVETTCPYFGQDVFFGPEITQSFYDIVHNNDDLLWFHNSSLLRQKCLLLCLCRNIYKQVQTQVEVKLSFVVYHQNDIKRMKETLSKTLNIKIVSFRIDTISSLKENYIVLVTPEQVSDMIKLAHTRNTFKSKVHQLIFPDFGVRTLDWNFESLLFRWKLVFKASYSRICLIGREFATCKDLASSLSSSWYNFRSSIGAPILEKHIQSFPQRNYSVRQNAMNKPILANINELVTEGSTVVFIHSKSQVEETTESLLNILKLSENPRKFFYASILYEANEMIEQFIVELQSEILKESLPYGIGYLSSSLLPYEQKVVLNLFKRGVIRILLCHTSRRHELLRHKPYIRLVIVKDIDIYNRNQHGVSRLHPEYLKSLFEFANDEDIKLKKSFGVLLCANSVKPFYKKFLSECFPIESDLVNHELFQKFVLSCFNDFELVSMQALWTSMQGTYLMKRLLANPSYYESILSLAGEGFQKQKLTTNKILKAFKIYFKTTISLLIDNKLIEKEDKYLKRLEKGTLVATSDLVNSDVNLLYSLVVDVTDNYANDVRSIQTFWPQLGPTRSGQLLQDVFICFSKTRVINQLLSDVKLPQTKIESFPFSNQEIPSGSPPSFKFLVAMFTPWRKGSVIILQTLSPNMKLKLRKVVMSLLERLIVVLSSRNIWLAACLIRILQIYKCRAISNDSEANNSLRLESESMFKITKEDNGYEVLISENLSQLSKEFQEGKIYIMAAFTQSKKHYVQHCDVKAFVRGTIRGAHISFKEDKGGVGHILLMSPSYPTLNTLISIN